VDPGGLTPKTVEEMARDCRRIHWCSGFLASRSVGLLARRFVSSGHRAATAWSGAENHLAGTGPAGRRGHRDVGAVLQERWQAGAANKASEAISVLYTRRSTVRQRPDDFLRRLEKNAPRSLTRPSATKNVQAQLAAIHAWGQGVWAAPRTVQHPVLVVNGETT